MVAYMTNLHLFRKSKFFIFISTTFKQMTFKYLPWYTKSQEKMLTDPATELFNSTRTLTTE